MIAEINNKISSSGSNISDRLEDLLTGNFFGCLRYLPFDSAMKSILLNSVNKPERLDCLKNINCSEWDKNILFWKRFSGTEPDIIIDFKDDDIIILIEVKLYSWCRCRI